MVAAQHNSEHPAEWASKQGQTHLISGIHKKLYKIVVRKWYQLQISGEQLSRVARFQHKRALHTEMTSASVVVCTQHATFFGTDCAS